MSSASGPASSSTKNGANGSGNGNGTSGHKSGAATTSAPSSARATKKSAFSCEPCRRRKVKCGGEQPVCSRCLARNDACVYKLWDPLPSSAPEATTSPHLTSPHLTFYVKAT